MCEREALQIWPFAGYAYTDLIGGRFYLRGLRANTCPSLGQVLYLPLQSSLRWLEAALIEESSQATRYPFNDLVNDLCPHVTRWEIESCYKPASLPGRISGLSKVKCDSWRLFKSTAKTEIEVKRGAAVHTVLADQTYKFSHQIVTIGSLASKLNTFS